MVIKTGADPTTVLVVELFPRLVHIYLRHDFNTTVKNQLSLLSSEGGPIYLFITQVIFHKSIL